jgi:hypothetical protein
LNDVLDYRRKAEERREEALAELAALGQELDSDN